MWVHICMDRKAKYGVMTVKVGVENRVWKQIYVYKLTLYWLSGCHSHRQTWTWSWFTFKIDKVMRVTRVTCVICALIEINFGHGHGP